MTSDIAAILAVDGVATGSIYVLVALGTVLIFTITRVTFIPFGDIAAFTALTLAAIENNKVPGTIGLVAILSVLATAMEVASLLRAGRARFLLRALGCYLVLPLAVVGLVRLALLWDLPMPVQIVMALALTMPVAPLLDRIVFRPIADGTVLLLLIVAVALHFALVGLGLLFFGPEGVRTEPLTALSLEVGGCAGVGPNHPDRAGSPAVRAAAVRLLRL